MIIFRDLQGRTVEALSDYRAQNFPVGPAFDPDRYHVEPHFGTDYRLGYRDGEIHTLIELDFQEGGEGVNGLSVEQVLSTIMDHLHKTDPNRPLLHYLRLAWWASQRDECEPAYSLGALAGVQGCQRAQDDEGEIGYGPC